MNMNKNLKNKGNIYKTLICTSKYNDLIIC